MPIFEVIMQSSHTTLIVLIALYLLATVLIGFYAGRKVVSSTDYILAGRSLPIYVVIATVFATWFGSETVLGTSSTFVKEGLSGVVADPFGASLCLVLVGMFFAKKLYRMNLVTINDYYRQRYSPDIEFVSSVVIMISYLGWVAAQLTALGLVFNVVSNGAIDLKTGLVVGAAIVLVYTIYGGMWAVALTDFFHMGLTVLGLIVIAWVITRQVPGGASAVFVHAAHAGKLHLLPETNLAGILGFIGALVTLGLGSIPQQDVFQRVMMAKNEHVAKNGAIIGGVLYFIFAMIPIYLAYSALLIDGGMVHQMLGESGDSQRVLPSLIMQHTPVFIQVLFFGALLSAITSCASATLLAPSTVFSNNIIKPLLRHYSDHQMLNIVRWVVLAFGILVTLFAIYKSDIGIFAMVENAYKITLCGAFVPLVFGLYWRVATTNGARLSMLFGIVFWLLSEVLEYDFGGHVGWDVIGLHAAAAICPPQLTGFIMAIVGMLLGSYCLPRDVVQAP